MEVLHPRCAGLDVHQKTVVACVRLAQDAKVDTEVRTFRTTTKGLLELLDWLHECECTHAAMESTGVYWKPVWHVLEGHLELLLVNAKHVRNVPGRKTDVKDATWLAELLAHGLVRGSFVPSVATQELRDLTRTRKQLVRERARHIQRIQKTLEDANIKLTGVISDVLGRSGRAFLEALIDGQEDPEKVVREAKGRLKATHEELVEALQGRVRDHHRFVLDLHLQQIDSLDAGIAEIERRLSVQLEPFRHQAELLMTMPGVSWTAAQTILSEMGGEMDRFPTPGHLVSWAGLCPRSDESAGKRRSTRIRKGAPWLKTVLVQCAWAAIRTKGSYLRARYFRLKSRRGPMKAIVAVAAAMLRAMHAMLQTGVVYTDLGEGHLDEHRRTRTANRLLRRLKTLGVEILSMRVRAPNEATLVSC